MDYIEFVQKSFVVVERTDNEQFADAGVMEDTDPFPYDSSEDELKEEVEYILGLKPYPENPS